MPKPPPASTRNPAFQSKLEPLPGVHPGVSCEALELSPHRGGFAAATRLERRAEHHLFLRQSSCQAPLPLCAAAPGRTETRPTRPGELQSAGVLQSARSQTR
jgi:hypothetical protein